jgi:hypothetical protein
MSAFTVRTALPFQTSLQVFFGVPVQHSGPLWMRCFESHNNPFPVRQVGTITPNSFKRRFQIFNVIRFMSAPCILAGYYFHSET